MTEHPNMDKILDYLTEHYSSSDAQRLAGIKAIAAMAAQTETIPQVESLIDKVALFNGIKKVR